MKSAIGWPAILTAGSYLLVDTPTITPLVDLLVDIVCSEPIT